MKMLYRGSLLMGTPIVILGLLFGAGHLQKTKRRNYCQGQLKSLGFALTLYAQDYDGRLPDAPQKTSAHNSTWLVKLTPYDYYTPSYICPADPTPFDTHSISGMHVTSYVWNDAYSAPNDHLTSPSGQNLNQIANPYQTVMLADGTGDFRFRWEIKDGATLPPEGDDFKLGSIVGRHNGRPNVLFCDGHVAYYGVQQTFMPRTRNGKSYFAGLSIEDD